MKLRGLIYDPARRDKTAYVDDGVSLTFGELQGRANAVRRALEDDCGQNIAIYLPSGADFLAALYGVIADGLTAFPLCMRLTAFELEPLLAQADVRTVVTDAAHAPLFGAPLKVVVTDGLAPEGADLPPVGVGENEPMALLATSGTTSGSKIVRLSEKNIAVCAQSYTDKMDYNKHAEVRYLLGTPYPSAYGLLVIFACALRAFPLVGTAENLTLGGFYRAVEKHGATHFEGGAAIAQLMAQTAGRSIPFDISSLKYMGFGGSKVTAETFRIFLKTYAGVEFWPGYGMTEAAPLIAKPDKYVPADKLDGVGTAIAGETLLIAAGDGLTNAPYVKGEIVVGGDNVMLGYYGNEEATRRAVRGGLLYTGDIGWLDEDGWLYICGRCKNVIIVRGFNVYAEEVEAALADSGLAADCSVYGETDDSGEETVCADVVPARPDVTERDVRAYCAARLAVYKQPRRVRIVAGISKTATGKNIKRGSGN